MPKFVGIILSVLVILLAFLIGLILYNPLLLLISGKRADALVVGMDRKANVSEYPEDSLLIAPRVEFVTSAGERISVTGRTYSKHPSVNIGETIKLAYSESNPKNTQLLTFAEFPLGPAGFVFGFMLLIILIWVSCILNSGESNLSDPFHLLPHLISKLNLNPIKFPIYFILAIVIPACSISTFVLTRDGLALRSTGIKVLGHIDGTTTESSRLNDNSIVRGTFPMVVFNDEKGISHTCRRSLVYYLSSLKIGDEVEVIYPVGNPKKAIVNTWDEIFLPALFFGIVSILFLIMLLLILRGSLF